MFSGQLKNEKNYHDYYFERKLSAVIKMQHRKLYFFGKGKKLYPFIRKYFPLVTDKISLTKFTIRLFA